MNRGEGLNSEGDSASGAMTWLASVSPLKYETFHFRVPCAVVTLAPAIRRSAKLIPRD